MLPAPSASVAPLASGPAIWWDWLAVALLVGLFVAIAGHQWRLPGLYNDEAYDVVPAMQLALGQPVELNRGVGVHLFGYDLPVMISDYQGVTSAYGILPLFKILGVGVLAIRSFTIGLGALALVLTYLLGQALFGRPVGLLATLLLAASPSLIFWSRVGVYVVVQVIPLALGAMLAYLRWRRGGRAGWLGLAGFLVGLGLSTKILFLWFIAGVMAAGVLVWLIDWRWPLDRDGQILPHRPWRARLRQPLSANWQSALLAAGSFLLGSVPLIYYNLASLGTLKVIRANLFQTEKGANNLAVWQNLLHQADAFQVLLQGSYFWWLGGVYANRLAPPLFLVSALGLAGFVTVTPAYRPYRRAVVVLYAMLATTFVLSAFTLSGLDTTHLLIMLPLPQLIVAAFVVLLGRTLARQVTGRATRAVVVALPAALLLFPSVVLDLRVDANYHRALAETGGKNTFSSAIYELAAFLDRYDYTEPYLLDWGMKYNVELLTMGRVRPREIYGQTPTPPPSFYAALDALFADERVVYVAHRDEGLSVPTAYPGRVSEFKRLAESRGKKVVPLKVINESGGAPLFYVYSVRDQ